LFSVTPAAGAQVVDEIISNPAISGQPILIGKRHIASSGTRSAILYVDSLNRPWAYVRDSAAGTSAHLQLPQTTGASWSAVSYVLRASDDLWVLAGTGPVQLREYRLSGDPLPTSAALLSSTTVGDSDSRPDDLTTLASAGLVAVWHQQGSSGPQGLNVSYRGATAASWSTLSPLNFMPTSASKFVVAQHPADASVWVFGNPDSWGSIGAAHLTEVSGALRLDWTNAQFISSADGAYDADPENPDVEIAADPTSGVVALAYQSAVRKMFSTSPVVTGSYVAVARIAADGTKSFTSMSEYVERVSNLGFVVRPGEDWLGYRPIQSDNTFSDLYLRRGASGAWDTPIFLGRLYSPYQQVLTGIGSSEIVTRLSDGKVHLFSVGSGGTTSSPSPTPTTSVSPTPTTSPTHKPTTRPTPTPTPTPTATPTPTPTSTPTPTDTPSETPCTGDAPTTPTCTPGSGSHG